MTLPLHTSSGVNMFAGYARQLQSALATADWSTVHQLSMDALACWQAGRQILICGNGGSAGNAIHLANDFLYGIAKQTGRGWKALALPANAAVLTCLANDLGYDHVFSEQVAVHAEKGDLLLVLSGSGNSANIVRAVERAKDMGVKTFAVLGYSGGQCKNLVDVPIHFPVDDMQIAEDLQLVVGHMVMQWLFSHRPSQP